MADTEIIIDPTAGASKEVMAGPRELGGYDDLSDEVTI